MAKKKKISLLKIFRCWKKVYKAGGNWDDLKIELMESVDATNESEPIPPPPEDFPPKP